VGGSHNSKAVWFVDNTALYMKVVQNQNLQQLVITRAVINTRNLEMIGGGAHNRIRNENHLGTGKRISNLYYCDLVKNMLLCPWFSNIRNMWR
jgi:hypothetical protein